MPKAAPVADDVSWEALGRSYEIAGGSIKQAVIRAATRAALRMQVGDVVATGSFDCTWAGACVRPVVVFLLIMLAEFDVAHSHSGRSESNHND